MKLKKQKIFNTLFPLIFISMIITTTNFFRSNGASDSPVVAPLLDESLQNVTPNISDELNYSSILNSKKNFDLKKKYENTLDEILNTPLAKPVKKTPINQKKVFLTFDDGYGRENIIRVLDAYKKHNLKATFFIVGQALYSNQDLWKRAVLEGHKLCNHTYNHPDFAKKSDETIKSEIQKWETAVSEVLGKDYLKNMKANFPYFRFPYGSGAHNKRLLNLIQSLGYKSFYWDMETYSTVIAPNIKSSTDTIGKKITDYVSSKVKNDNIVLLHFNIYDSKYIDDTITKLLDKGYVLEQL